MTTLIANPPCWSRLAHAAIAEHKANGGGALIGMVLDYAAHLIYDVENRRLPSSWERQGDMVTLRDTDGEYKKVRIVEDADWEVENDQ